MTPRWMAAVSLASALGAGLIAGVFFAFSAFIMPALARLSAANGVAAMQSINVVVLNRWFLSVFVGTALSSGALAVSALWSWHEPAAVLRLCGGLCYLLGVLVVTRAFNIPRNDALAVLVPESLEAAAAWPVYVREWSAYNHARTLAALAAAALFTLAFARS